MADDGRTNLRAYLAGTRGLWIMGGGLEKKKEIRKRDKRKPRTSLPPPLSYLPRVPLELLSTPFRGIYLGGGV